MNLDNYKYNLNAKIFRENEYYLGWCAYYRMSFEI